jgi:histidine decarboxylase
MLNFREDLKCYLDKHLNNVGDPFTNGAFMANTKYVERMVLDYYASLWNAKWPSLPPHNDINADGQNIPCEGDPETYWGYVLTMGSTEGTLYSVFTAREYLSGVKLLSENYVVKYDNDTQEKKCSYSLFKANSPKAEDFEVELTEKNIKEINAYIPVAFFSQDAHYSIIKAMRTMEVTTFSDLGNSLYEGQCPFTLDGVWPSAIPSEEKTVTLPIGSGAVNIDKLALAVEFFAERGHPAMVILNYGSTFKGAYDDVEGVCNVLEPIFKKHGLMERKVYWGDEEDQFDQRAGYWIHVDGALGASYMPFVEMAHNAGKLQDRGPNFDFRLPMVTSIACSGHKWPGAPWPTGIFMTKNKFMITPPSNPEYIGSPDTTFAGSRNGISPLVLWDFIASNSYDELVTKAVHSQDMADIAFQSLRTLQKEIGVDIWLQRTPMSLGVLFRLPKKSIVQEFSLAEETIHYDENEERTYAHIYCMWDVTEKLIKSLIDRLKEKDAFPEGRVGTIHRESPPSKKSNSKGEHKGSLPIVGRSFR